MKKPAPSSYQPCGLCSFCLLALESEAGGVGVRHVADQVEYGDCPQAIRAFSDVRVEKSAEL